MLQVVQVQCLASQRSEVKDIADIYNGVVAHLTPQTLTMEVIGNEAKMQSLQAVLQPYGILEVARTGRVALERESRVDSRLLHGSQLGPYV
jgi:acetolactate synthase-1/3 small subunit